jgi:hypothetical protein
VHGRAGPGGPCRSCILVSRPLSRDPPRELQVPSRQPRPTLKPRRRLRPRHATCSSAPAPSDLWATRVSLASPVQIFLFSLFFIKKSRNEQDQNLFPIYTSFKLRTGVTYGAGTCPVADVASRSLSRASCCGVTDSPVPSDIDRVTPCQSVRLMKESHQPTCRDSLEEYVSSSLSFSSPSLSSFIPLYSPCGGSIDDFKFSPQI